LGSYFENIGHLKDIPSAEVVKKDGFFLGEMDAKLLQKIEELTLYTIEQDKKLKSQETILEEQNIKIEKLKKEAKLVESLRLQLLEIQRRLDNLEN